MRNARHAAAAALLPVILAGCGCSSGCLATATPIAVIATAPASDLASAGTLTICSDLRRPPLDTVIDGQPSGADVEIGEGISLRMGLTSRVKSTDRAAISAALSSGSCDIGLSGLKIGGVDTVGLTMVRYGILTESLVTLAARATSASNLSDLCGDRIGVIDGSEASAWANRTGDYSTSGAFDECAVPGSGRTQVLSYASSQGAAEALTNGRVEALLVDSIAGGQEPIWSKNGFTVAPNVGGESIELGVAVAPAKHSLISVIEKVLQTMTADGSLSGLWVRTYPLDESAPSN